MKKPVILWMILVSVLMTATAYGQTALDALRALKKLEARIEIGLNYKEYALYLADAKVDTTFFLESSAAWQNRALSEKINRILDHYEMARLVWNLKVTKTEDFGTAFGHLMSMQSGEEGALSRRLLKMYPQANKSVDKGGVLTMGSYGIRGTNEILVDKMIGIIWKEASKELKEAIRMVVR